MFNRSTSTLLVVSALVLAVFAFSAAVASASEGWWYLSSASDPAYLAPGEEGDVVVSAENIGETGIEGEAKPVTVTDVLPEGLTPLGIVGVQRLTSITNNGVQLLCSLAHLGCTLEHTLTPFTRIEVRIRVRVQEEARSGGENRVSVSGGGAPAASIARPLVVSGLATPFGAQEWELRPEQEGGVPDTQAGSHPFQVSGSVAFNAQADTAPLASLSPFVEPAGMVKDIVSKLPPGLVGTAQFPRCTLTQFDTIVFAVSVPVLKNECPLDSQVGVSSVVINEPSDYGTIPFLTAVFNIEPAYGEPARLGFFIPPFANAPVLLQTSLRSGPGEDYGISLTARNDTQTAATLSAQVTVWGVPGDPRHNLERGEECLHGGECPTVVEPHPRAFLTMPTSCVAPMKSSVEVDSWGNPGVFLPRAPGEPLPALDGCNQLAFTPTISAEPTTDRASAPSGLDFNLNFHDEGLTNGEGIAQSQLNKTVVTLPEGLTINPSAGVGLGGCTEADYARESVDSAPGAGCPNDSKLGTVEIETPLLAQKIHGSIFIAQPYENPSHSLVALYVVAKNPEAGILIKLAGKVSPNLVTGQLTTIFENNPPVPFNHFNFHFREGQQAPLISPPTCGTYETKAELTPWAEPTTVLTDTSQFTITKGYEGGPCPSGGVPPFHPGIQSGTLNNNAGAFSSLYVHLSRTDAEQEIAGFSTDLPPGLTGDLTGVPFCPEADIEAARHKTGAQEEAESSCPAASQIGRTLVGTGVGAVLAYVPGKIYLAGPFGGAPFSVVSVTSAKVGPFDLGTVVLRFGLNINSVTAQVSVNPTSSEPIPTIIDGIVTHVRDIRVYIDRPSFILNPTSCSPLAIGSTLTSNLAHSATVTSPFQAASCANLKFAPKFAVSTSGKTSRASGASLAVKLAYPANSFGQDANIAKVKVELPKQLPSRLTTLQKACTTAQFESNPGGCPAGSIVGHAIAVTPILPVPLTGPAYFVSHGGAKFPELIIVLQGYGVTIDLHGETFISPAGITSSTFRTVPDQPVTSFELTLPEGADSALAANGNLCKSKLAMPTEFLAQNGAVLRQSTHITVEGCTKHKHKLRKRARHSKGTALEQSRGPQEEVGISRTGIPGGRPFAFGGPGRPPTLHRT